jgi:hypothetical protein
MLEYEFSAFARQALQRVGDEDFTLQFDPEHHVLLISMGKVVTQASASAAANAVRSFVTLQNVDAGIADLSAVERIGVSADFVRFLASKPPAIPCGKVSILVAPRDETYGMSRMFQILRERVEDSLKVVHTLQEAYGLLGLDSLNLAIR